MHNLKRPIDIEYLLQWAFEQTGVLPWRGVSERSLAYDHGYDAIPKGSDKSYSGGETLLRCDVPPDAAMVLAAVNRLPPSIREVVKACALSQIRPNWMQGIEPQLVERKVYWQNGHAGKKRKKHTRKKSHRSRIQKVWEPCSPETICAVRQIYSEWHAALGRLTAILSGNLLSFDISGFSAPETPWGEAIQKIA